MGEAPPWTIRRATTGDIVDLVRLRLMMMAEMAGNDGAQEEDAALAGANHAYMRETMPAGEFLAYVAESGGEIVATSGLRIYRMAPHTGNLGGMGAYVLNMYTLPGWRRQGLASALLERVVQHAREAGAKSVSLRASAAGRAVYERYGFTGDPSFMTFRFADSESPE